MNVKCGWVLCAGCGFMDDCLSGTLPDGVVPGNSSIHFTVKDRRLKLCRKMFVRFSKCMKWGGW